MKQGPLTIIGIFRSLRHDNKYSPSPCSGATSVVSEKPCSSVTVVFRSSNEIDERLKDSSKANIEQTRVKVEEFFGQDLDVLEPQELESNEALRHIDKGIGSIKIPLAIATLKISNSKLFCRGVSQERSGLEQFFSLCPNTTPPQKPQLLFLLSSCRLRILAVLRLMSNRL